MIIGQAPCYVPSMTGTQTGLTTEARRARRGAKLRGRGPAVGGAGGMGKPGVSAVPADEMRLDEPERASVLVRIAGRARL
jgi:hypothetical protein